jgi:hypothetical protein
VRVFHLCVFPHIVGLFEEEADESFAIFGKPRFVQSKVSGLNEMSPAVGDVRKKGLFTN